MTDVVDIEDLKDFLRAGVPRLYHEVGKAELALTFDPSEFDDHCWILKFQYTDERGFLIGFSELIRVPVEVLARSFPAKDFRIAGELHHYYIWIEDHSTDGGDSYTLVKTDEKRYFDAHMGSVIYKPGIALSTYSGTYTFEDVRDFHLIWAIYENSEEVSELAKTRTELRHKSRIRKIKSIPI